MSNSADSATKPRYKKKFFLRVEAIVPFGIIVTLIVLYFVLFFDLHLRKGIEWFATEGNGAEVNVGYLKTSFLRGTFAMGDIQVTDPDEPSKNRVHVGSVSFNLLMDALLRAKFVISQASITDIATGTARRSPGRVLPTEGEGASLSSKLKKKASEEFKKTGLANIGKLLEGFDPTKQLKDIGNLKTLTRIQELQGQLSKKQGDWNNGLKAIPSQQEITAIQNKVNAIKVGGDPGQIQGQIQQIQGVITEANQKISEVKSKGDSLAGDVNGFGQSVGQLDALVQQDKKDLENKIKLPSLDSKDLASQLFGPSIMSKVGQVERYIALSRQYMPSKKAKTEDSKPSRAALKPPRRGEGVNYEFGKPNSYPHFWLQKAVISSKAGASPFGGNLEGQLLDFTTNPAMIGRPAVAFARGNFPNQQMSDVEGRVTFDHTGEIPSETVRATIGTYPVANQLFSESDDLKFGFNKANAGAGVTANFKGEQFAITFDTDYRQVDYRVEAQSKLLESTLRGIVKDIPAVKVQAKLTGTWDTIAFGIDSNLAGALQQGFSKQLQAKVAEARQKIDSLVQEKVGAQKAALTKQFDDNRAKILGQVDERRKQAEAVQQQAQGKLTQAQNQANAAAEAAKQKALGEARKKLPF